MKFKTTTVEDTEMIYSLLREKYPECQVDIEFNYNKKEYTLCVTNKSFKEDPEVPLDLNIEVIYGDSVTGDTPILLKKNDTIYIETIQSIFNEKQKVSYPGFKLFDKTIRLEKEYSLTDYQVWSDIGWVDIDKVIRHKCDKKIYRVLTHTGCVDITEDHSLVKEDKTIVKPFECDLETKLLTNYPHEFRHIDNISKDRAYIYGFFYGDGSCGRYESVTGIKYTWTLNNSDLNVLANLKQLLMKEYPTHTPIIYDTIKSSNVYKLTVNNPKELVEEYRQIFYDSDKYKKVPTDILNSSNVVIQSFFDGYFAADGCRKDKELIGCTRFDNKGKIGSAGLYFLVKKLGYNVSLNTRSDKNNIIRQTITKLDQRKTPNKIKKIEVLQPNGPNHYVYDIETTCGRFQAGIGDIIVRNTDSIMVRFKYNRDDYEKNRVDTFNMAILCGDKLTNEVFKRPPIEMEFEKVFQPFVLLTKKRYIAHKYDNTKDPFQLKGVDAKGIALTRRDYCKMVKNCYREVIDAIMDIKKPNGLQESIEIFKAYIKKIDKYEVEIEDLIVSAMLAKSYKTKPVHVILAEKLKERKEEVQIGDRIPYIFIESDDPKKQKSELGEDPKYAVKHNLKFNRKCYLEQLAKPLLGFFRVCLKDQPLLQDELIQYVNKYLINYGGTKLKPSDFKIED
jgi:hypothetical protein